MAFRGASIREVRAWRAVDERESVRHTHVWGPVGEAEAAEVGCVHAAASVVIRPQIASHVVAAALQCVPAEVLPRADDTRETLVARLGASAFLDAWMPASAAVISSWC